MINNSNDNVVVDKIKIFETICLWSDLLGYGSSFYKSNWDLTSEASTNNLLRIKSLEKLIKTVPVPLIEKVLLLNDGMIRNVDIVKKGSYIEMYLMWLENAVKQFFYINYFDKQKGNPGICGVLTYGERAQYTSEIIRVSDVVKYTSSKPDENVILYSPNEFQMNTAFSKAYIIESEGSKAGIKGSNLYVDEFFIYKFIHIINESESKEVTKLIGKSIKTYTMKFYGDFQNKNNQISLNVKIKCMDVDIDFMKIKFALDAIIYDNVRCNIKTKLYKIIDLWSAENGSIDELYLKK